MNNSRLITLKCPNCNGQLEIGPAVDTFACGYCGASVQVERGGNIVSLHLLSQTMSAVQRGTDRTAAELAFRRLSEELAVAESKLVLASEKRQGAERKWEKELKSVAPSDGLLPVIILAVIVWIVVNVTLAEYSKIPPAIALSIGAIAGLFAALRAWKFIKKQQRNLLDEKQELSKREVEPLAEAERQAEGEIDKVKAKLSAQRVIVDNY